MKRHGITANGAQVLIDLLDSHGPGPVLHAISMWCEVQADIAGDDGADPERYIKVQAAIDLAFDTCRRQSAKGEL